MAITLNTFFKRRCRQTVLAHPLDPPPDVAQNRDRDRSVLHRWTGPSFRIGSIMLHSDASPPSEAISQCKGQDRAFKPLWNPSGSQVFCSGPLRGGRACTFCAGGMMDAKSSRTAKAQFGVPGLDDILSGGLIRNRQYLFEGTPGSGKTTLALQFLLEGARQGEKGLYTPMP